MSQNNASKAVALSLFSGAGGLDIGSELAGVPVLLALDNEKECTTTMRNNKIFKNTIVENADITKYPIGNYKKVLKEADYDFWILIGGPPCQPFSKAGYWVGNNVRLKENDPRNMIGHYVNLVKKLKPDYFLMENVESILHPTHKGLVSDFITQTRKMNYHTKIFKANALDYGVPQKRKRVFFFGSLRGFEIDQPTQTHFPESEEEVGLQPHVSVGKVIKKYNIDKYFEKEEITIDGTYGKDLMEVPPGKNYIALTEARGYSNPKFVAGKRFWSFLLKLHPDMPSWTIAAQPGPWVGPFHWNSRRLRVPEIKAIQTFPETYNIIGNRRSIQRQVGNAVPPLLSKAMISYLKENM